MRSVDDICLPICCLADKQCLESVDVGGCWLVVDAYEAGLFHFSVYFSEGPGDLKSDTNEPLRPSNSVHIKQIEVLVFVTARFRAFIVH